MAETPQKYLSGLDIVGLREFMNELDEPSYRAGQLMNAFWKKGKRFCREASTLPLVLRETLAEKLPLHPWSPLERKEALDGTVKFLLEEPGGDRIETVCIPSSDGRRRTVCVSTQTGCAIGCRFCATGTLGPGRDLNTAEIAGQVLFCRLEIGEITNVVFMGMGEPLLNPDAVLPAIRILREQKGAALGKRRITLSTIGIVPGIRRMARECWPVRLAVSLHSADEETRRMLVPGLKYELREIIDAARSFRNATHRTVTVEYVLLRDVNDSRKDAETLAGLLEGGGFKVNLIPWNAVSAGSFSVPGGTAAKTFRLELDRAGIPVSVRESAGADISAACGQLTARSSTPPEAG